MLSNLPRASIAPWLHAARLPFLNFIDSLVVSASQDAGGYEISRQNNLEFPYLLIELLYIGMPLVRTDGRSVYDHVITKFSRMDMGLRVRGAPL